MERRTIGIGGGRGPSPELSSPELPVEASPPLCRRGPVGIGQRVRLNRRPEPLPESSEAVLAVQDGHVALRVVVLVDLGEFARAAGLGLGSAFHLPKPIHEPCCAADVRKSKRPMGLPSCWKLILDIALEGERLGLAR